MSQIEGIAHEHLEAEAKLAKVGPLRPELRLVEDLELDSLDLATLAMEVEEHFGILIDPEDEERIQTLGDLVAAIRRQLEAEDPQPGA